MPLYEYRCDDCSHRSTILVRSISNPSTPSCLHCGGDNLSRLISKFSFKRSWGDSLNWMPDSGPPDDPAAGDPAAGAEWMGDMRREMGGHVSSEFNETLGAVEREAGHSHDHDE